eukprot:4442500-Pleurochrysis_carterae.AAC.1
MDDMFEFAPELGLPTRAVRSTERAAACVVWAVRSSGRSASMCAVVLLFSSLVLTSRQQSGCPCPDLFGAGMCALLAECAARCTLDAAGVAAVHAVRGADGLRHQAWALLCYHCGREGEFE